MGWAVKHPDQPIVMDGDTARWQANPIVEYLLDRGGIDMNDLHRLTFREGWSDDDRAHFAQLTGYSVDMWGDLPYVKPGAASRADRRAARLRAAQEAP